MENPIQLNLTIEFKSEIRRAQLLALMNIPRLHDYKIVLFIMAPSVKPWVRSVEDNKAWILILKSINKNWNHTDGSLWRAIIVLVMMNIFRKLSPRMKLNSYIKTYIQSFVLINQPLCSYHKYRYISLTKTKTLLFEAWEFILKSIHCWWCCRVFLLP